VDVSVAAAVHLHRGLAIDHRRDDLARTGLGLLAHHDRVAVTDRSVDHRVAADPQSEHVATPGEFAGQRQNVIDVLLGHDGSPRGDIADHGHGHRVVGAAARPRLLQEDPHVDRPAHRPATPEEALLLQARHVLRHRRR
jgi:hypothetical protein